jgi:enoyl-CoA hydratase/carnithine racemase
VGEFVRLDISDRVATVRLNRPPVNALSRAMLIELDEVVGAVGDDPDVRAVVLYGGERVFAAGADINELQRDYPRILRRAEQLSTVCTVVARLPKPVIAAVTGYAVGGGCELALSADFRISAEDARWGQPEILLGIIPGAGGTQRLPRLIGSARAKDLIFSGRMIDAAEARRIGLVDTIVPAGDVLETAHQMAARYVSLPPLALQAAKTAIDAGFEIDLASGLRLETQLFRSLFATEDARIGVESFLRQGPGKAEFVGR